MSDGLEATLLRRLDFALNKTGKRLAQIWAALTFLLLLSVQDRVQAQNQAEVRRGHAGAVVQIAYSPDGRSFASASIDRSIKIWSTDSNTEIRTLRGHRGELLSIAYSPDGRYIASASVGLTVKIWDANTGAPIRTLQGNDNNFAAVTFMSDGKTIATPGIGVLRLWSISDGKVLRTFQTPEALAWSLRVSRDGRLMAWGGNGLAHVLDANTGRVMWSFPTRTDYCTSVAISPNGRILAVPVAKEQVELRDPRSGTLVRTLIANDERNTPSGGLHSRPYEAVALSSDGRALVAVSSEVCEWDIATGVLVSASKFHTGPMMAVDYSPDGHVGTEHAADMDQAQHIERVPPDNSPMGCIRALRGETFRVANPDPQFHKADSNSRPPLRAAFSPDGDADHHGDVSTLELAEYIDTEVPALAEQTFKQAQYPTVAPGGQGIPVTKVN